MDEKYVIAVHACGFESKDVICPVAKYRLTRAASKAREANINNIIISGGPPYQKGSELLAHMMGQWLNIKKFNISYATDCYDSSTDIQNIIKIAKEKGFNNIKAISSYWHLWALKPLYKYWGRQLNYFGEIDFVYTPKSIDQSLTGIRTRIFYFFYSCLLHLALLFHLFKPLDKFLSSIFSKRKNGYPVSGCS